MAVLLVVQLHIPVYLYEYISLVYEYISLCTSIIEVMII